MITHKHHIIPKHMGGTDDPDNLIELTPQEHADAHLRLYEEFGKKEDLTAFYLLIGHLKEGFEERSRLGGKIQGKINAETGHIQSIARSQTSEQHSINGKKGAEVCRSKGVNAFFDSSLRKRISSAGGSVQGKNNAESGHLKTISVQYWTDVKSGKVDRTKKAWYHSTIEKRSILVKDGDAVPDGYVIGRKIKW